MRDRSSLLKLLAAAGLLGRAGQAAGAGGLAVLEDPLTLSARSEIAAKPADIPVEQPTKFELVSGRPRPWA
jgi:hypothetical protein